MLIVAVSISYLFPGNILVMLSAYGTVAGLVYLGNYHYITKMNDTNNVIEFQNAIFVSVLKDCYDFCIIFDNRQNIVYADDGFHKRFADNRNIYLMSPDEILKIYANSFRREKKDSQDFR